MTTRLAARTLVDPDRDAVDRAIARRVPADTLAVGDRPTAPGRVGQAARRAARDDLVRVTTVRATIDRDTTARGMTRARIPAEPAHGTTVRADRWIGPGPAIDRDHRTTGHPSIADLVIGRPPDAARVRTGGIGRLPVRGHPAMTDVPRLPPASPDVPQARTDVHRGPATHRAAAAPAPVAHQARTVAHQARTAARRGRMAARPSGPPTRRPRCHRPMSSARTRS